MSACSSDPGSGPLAADVAQRGFATCIAAPNPPAHINAWNTPIGFSTADFVNVSRSRLTVEKVSLINAHNLILHGALVYDESPSKHSMIAQSAWDLIADSVPASARSQIQYVPGAVIKPGFPTASFKPRPALTIYEIVPDISLAMPGGGWAIGIAVTYRADGTTYTVKAYTGYGIGASLTNKKYCNAQLAAINHAFQKQ
jgi:hypothetical protein